MGIMDQIKENKVKKRKEEEEAEQGEQGVKEQEKKPAPEQTLAEILNDKTKSHLFYQLLENGPYDRDLPLRIAEGKLEADDIHTLDEARARFLEKIAQSEKVENLVSEENITQIATNHPDFEKIIKLVGPKKAIAAIRNQLKEICFNDEERFNQIAGPIEAYDNYKKGTYKERNDEVEKLCEDLQITPEEYAAAMAIEDPEEKREALKQLSNRTHGKFKKVMNFLSGGKWEWTKNTSLEALENSETSLEDAEAELDSYKNAIGDTLFLSVNNSDDMRHALSRELISESTPAAETRTGFSDAKKDAFNEEEFDEAWEEEKKRAKYETLGDSDKDSIRDRFVESQKEKYKRKIAKRGKTWSTIFAVLSKGKIQNKKKTLK